MIATAGNYSNWCEYTYNIKMYNVDNDYIGYYRYRMALDNDLLAIAVFNNEAKKEYFGGNYRRIVLEKVRFDGESTVLECADVN